MAAKIKSGDLVKVIRGKVTGDMALYNPTTGNTEKLGRLYVMKGKKGIVAVEAPIHRSNVMVIDPETKQPTRVGITVKEEARDGKVKTVRVRVAKKSGKELA